MRVPGEGINELVDKLGSDAVDPRQLEKLAQKAPLPVLERLRLAYASTATEVSKFGRGVKDTRVDLPPFGFHPSPRVMLPILRPYVAAGYYNDPTAEAHDSSSKRALVANLMNARRSKGTKLVRLLHTDARVRAAFEKHAAASVVNDGRTDGFVTLSRLDSNTPRSSGGVATSVSAMVATDASGKPDMFALMLAMDQEVLAQAAKIGVGSSSGNWSAVAGLDLVASFPTIGASAAGMTSGTTPDGYQPSGNASVDVAVMNLKRMIDKRAQAMDSYNAVFTKYNENAKQAIDNMRG